MTVPAPADEPFTHMADRLEKFIRAVRDYEPLDMVDMYALIVELRMLGHGAAAMAVKSS